MRLWFVSFLHRGTRLFPVADQSTFRLFIDQKNAKSPLSVLYDNKSALENMVRSVPSFVDFQSSLITLIFRFLHLPRNLALPSSRLSFTETRARLPLRRRPIQIHRPHSHRTSFRHARFPIRSLSSLPTTQRPAPIGRAQRPPVGHRLEMDRLPTAALRYDPRNGHVNAFQLDLKAHGARRDFLGGERGKGWRGRIVAECAARRSGGWSQERVEREREGGFGGGEAVDLPSVDEMLRH
jgi:hypothetical protein